MVLRTLIRSMLLICLFIAIAYLSMRRSDKSKLFARMPFLLICASLPLYLAVIYLPEGAPVIFEKVLGHSIWGMYRYPPQANGIQESETWLAARWLHPVWIGYMGCILIGGVWAIYNVIRGRARKLNIAVLVLGFCYVAFALYLSITCFPFCV